MWETPCVIRDRSFNYVSDLHSFRHFIAAEIGFLLLDLQYPRALEAAAFRWCL